MNKFHTVIIFMILLLFFIIPSVYSEQIEPLIYTDVVEVKDAESPELYRRCKLWFADTFVDSKNVLEIEDQDVGMLVGKGVIRYEPNVFMSSTLTRGFIRFTVKIMIKDGRYKYLFTDFTHQGSYSSSGFGPINFGLITTATTCPTIQGTSKGMREALWNNMKQVSEQEAKKLINSLELAMLKPASIEENW